MPQPDALWPSPRKVLRQWLTIFSHFIFSSEYYQTLIATHLPTPEGWKAELTLVSCYMPRWFTRSQTVTHPSTNRAQCRLTSLIKPTPLTTTPRRLESKLLLSKNCHVIKFEMRLVCFLSAAAAYTPYHPISNTCRQLWDVRLGHCTAVLEVGSSIWPQDQLQGTLYQFQWRQRYGITQMHCCTDCLV